MIFIIGGAYQGKCSFAMEKLLPPGSSLCDCRDTAPDFSKNCLCHLEHFVRKSMEEGSDPVAFWTAHREAWKDAILICRDVSCGVVPMDPVQRQWRQEVGKLCQYLAGEATEVYRVFCGLEQRIK